MLDKSVIYSLFGVDANRKKSKLPAYLDLLQSLSGLILGLFMVAHMFFVSSILISDEFMWKITKMFEGSFIIKGGEPFIVSIIAFCIFVILIVHAALAMRKLPMNLRQFRILRTHVKNMNHSDTTSWFVQAITGFILFFIATIHLYVVMVRPDTIGPFGSSYRFVHQNFWLLYIVLLITVELHLSIGLYRLAIKWGYFEGLSVEALHKIKLAISIFFIVLGLFTYAAYVKKGLTIDPNANPYTLDIQTYGHAQR